MRAWVTSQMPPLALQPVTNQILTAGDIPMTQENVRGFGGD
jgi:hypothetical protein